MQLVPVLLAGLSGLRFVSTLPKGTLRPGPDATSDPEPFPETTA
jgi:hypothetical protein